MVTNFNELIQLVYCKGLSHSEKQYLNVLLDGLNNQVITSNNWLNTSEAYDLFNDKPKDVKDYLRNNTRLYNSLLTIIEGNVDDSIDYVTRFYKAGKRVANNQLGYNLGMLASDNTALNILTDYNSNLISDINNELLTGIIGTIGAGVLGGVALSELKKEIIDLPSKPLNSPVSVETRVNMSARTEYTRSVNTGTLQTYANHNITQVEIVSAGDDLVCTVCEDLEANNPYSLEEIGDLIPVHPSCRCGVHLLKGSSDDIADEPLIIDLTN